MVQGGLGALLIHGTTRYPQGHGAIERFHRTAYDQVLRSLDGAADVDPACAALTLRLRHFLERYNDTPHETLGKDTTPRQCWERGRDLRFPTDDADLYRRFVVRAMHKVSNDHVIKADGRLWEAPRGSAASWVEVARHVLDSRLWVPHKGRMIELAEVDPQANATEPRGSGSAPQPPADEDGDELPATAAGIAYANDLRPLVDPDGGYSDPHDDQQHDQHDQPSRSRPALPPSAGSRSRPPDRLWCISPRTLCPASATVSLICAATAASICPASTCRSSLLTGCASIPNATNSLSTRPCNGSARHYCCWTPWFDSILSTKTALQTSLLCSAFCAPSTAAINSLWSSSTTWPSAPGAISASPCAAPPISMPGPTPPAISCAAPTTVCNSPSSTAPLPLPTPSCCASQAAATSPSRCSSTALPPRRHRSPRRSAPLSAALASHSPGPSCANACASTTLVSVSLSRLSNNAASPSAAPTAGTCPHDPHRPLPSCSHPVTVPLFHRSAPGTHSERNDHRHRAAQRNRWLHQLPTTVLVTTYRRSDFLKLLLNRVDDNCVRQPHCLHGRPASS